MIILGVKTGDWVGLIRTKPMLKLDWLVQVYKTNAQTRMISLSKQN